ncbi:MAG: type 4a pilus biogenesis protein PilO [candidate division WOR-3 bacterium]
MNLLQRKWLVGGLIVLFLIIVIFVIFLYQPKIASRAKLKSEAKALKTKIEELRKLAKETEVLKQRIAKLEEENREFVARIAPRSEVLQLVRQLSEEAKKYNIKFLSIRPPGLDTLLTQETKENPLRPIPFEITLQGRYLDIGKFIADLRKFPYFIKVYELEFTGKDEIKPLIEARILVNIFASSLVGKIL